MAKGVGGSAEEVVKDLRQKARRRFSAEEKIRIVLEGLRGEESIASDLGLARLWEEPGREEPDSLVEGLRSLRERVRASADE